jgi:nicotinamidase-related amidase
MFAKQKLPHNTALIIIDLQKAIDQPYWGVRNNYNAENNIGLLLARWRNASEPIIHIRYVSKFPDSGYRPGQEGVEFKDVALPHKDELVITKPGHSSFIGTNLESVLHEMDITHVILTGVITNNSVEATARHSADLGFVTIVVSDAVFTFGKKGYNGIFHTADEVHAMSLANLEGEYASIYTTNEILQMVE